MEFIYPFMFIKCQSCDAKIHCDDCGAAAVEKLKTIGVEARVETDMKNKTIIFETDPDREDEVLDELDAMGVLV